MFKKAKERFDTYKYVVIVVTFIMALFDIDTNLNLKSIKTLNKIISILDKHPMIKTIVVQLGKYIEENEITLLSDIEDADFEIIEEK